jgi:hypothetical protein
MPKGMIVVNGSIFVPALILTFIFADATFFVISCMFLCLFNLFIGATNSSDNINSKFRRWLFGN